MNNLNGFTLIEVLLTMALFVGIGMFVFSLQSSYLQSQVLSDTTHILSSALRNAYFQSYYQKNDTSYGVKILSGSFVIFQGETYASRNQAQDQIFPVSNNVTISGVDEVIFTQKDGTVIQDESIILTFGAGEEQILIGQSGKIEK